MNGQCQGREKFIKLHKDQGLTHLVNQSMTDAGQVRLILRKALSVWERSSKLTFREVYSDQADIQVLFARRDHGDGYKFDGPGQILAHAFYPGVGRGGDAHFDDDENWSFGASNTEEATLLTYLHIENILFSYTEKWTATAAEVATIADFANNDIHVPAATNCI
uniref:Peptidase metallopeptidase domain-containing protein n=1 Tax=Glossina pallidipes TaxID=7398 RepID=A0A1B0ADA0_GLOPL